MQIGVVGVGRMGRFHARFRSGLSAIDRIVLADANDQRAVELAGDLGAESASFPEMVEDVDGVVITASTSAHPELIMHCVDAGKPSFCEKPISLDLASSDRVVDYAREANGQVQMGFQRGFDPGHRAAHELVESGWLGDLYAIRMAGHDPEPSHEDYIAGSGGMFRDFSVHDFDAIRLVTGQEVLNIYADGSVIRFPVFEKYDDIDTGAALLRLESGALGILSATRHNPLGYDIRMELHGSGDSVAVGWDDQIPLRSPLALHAARAGRPRHRSHPRCARANQIHRVVSARTGCRSGQQTPIGHQPSRGGLVDFAISESKGSDAMDASDTSGVARHRTQEGGKQC